MARKLDKKKRELILRVAREGFGKGGYQQTSIKTIAIQAGLAQGTVYTYFKNKDALFLAVVGDIWNEFIHGIKQITQSSAQIFEQMQNFIEFGFDLLVQIHPLLRGMYSEANRRELLTERVEEIQEIVEELFSRARNSGSMNEEWFSVEVRRFNLQLMIAGILFRVSITRPEELPGEIAEMKKGVITGLVERFGRKK